MAASFSPSVKFGLQQFLPQNSRYSIENLCLEFSHSFLSDETEENTHSEVLDDDEDEPMLLLSKKKANNKAQNVNKFNRKVKSDFDNYFADERASMKFLHSYPYMKKCFMKLNTILSAGQRTENKFFSNVYNELIFSKRDLSFIETKILRKDIENLNVNSGKKLG